ncbi:MAG: hypothetical protein A2Y82_05330 [Candidatus Buchananbacteria bacterium RBG_13_36_9]|uniref:Biotin-protein ligase N-terminal domain-containing protein n=1 Tax=Candidatus Buchananbacteria bacterium RBG_13_36_9 TaxID=1797530 RepID=A0A1G1XL52_9BACT|nr:MAG: hypothetical protein A2Y82_05330 [Candidatus Buchananbacteria bacterium RBG_13_36_9]
MKTIYLYTGKGAYQAKDVENFLAVFDFDYKRLNEHDLGELNSQDIFIVPGGEIKTYLPAWGTDGIKKIKEFVSSGGIYIGICGGAYVAGKSFKGVLGFNFFPKELIYRKFQSIIEVNDANGNRWQLIAENGPDLSVLDPDKIILTDNDAKPQAIQIKYGQGLVYLFSSHPEGSVFYNQLPQNFSGAKFFDQFLKRICAD